MDQILLKQLLSCFDNETFTKFIWEMWAIENCKELPNFVNLKRIQYKSSTVYEQCISKIYHADKEIGYNLILPFYEPLELFTNEIHHNIPFNPSYIQTLEMYSRRVERRINNWNVFTDGDYLLPNIAFVTNLSGYEEAFYQEYILPKLDYLVRSTGLEGLTKIGTCDSFIEINYLKTLQAFQSFIDKNKSMVISLTNGVPVVQEYTTEKYFKSGILSKIDAPTSPTYVHAVCKNQVLNEFQTLLRTGKNENELEKFLTKFYREVFGSKYDRIETQIWLRFPELDIGNRDRRLDLFLRNSVENDWELIELKHIVNPVRFERGIPSFSSRIYLAIEQLKNYGSLLKEDTVKRKLASLGLEYFVPELKLVISKKPDIDTRCWRMLKSNHEYGIKIITLDELFAEASMRYQTQLSLP